MPNTNDGRPAPADADPVLLMSCKRELEAERVRLNEEIGAYPAPIPACDAQFNHLIEQRRTIGEELQRLEALIDQRQTPGIEAADMLADIVARLMSVDGDLAARLQVAVAGKGLPAAGRRRQ
jgi:transposase InsO family protein